MEKLTITVNGEDSATGAADLLQLVAELTGFAAVQRPVDEAACAQTIDIELSLTPRLAATASRAASRPNCARNLPAPG